MIKKIIFDIDNTLMDFPKHFEEEAKKLLDKFNLNITPNDLYKAVGKYETCGNYTYYEEDKIIDLINNTFSLKLDKSFLEEFFNMYNKLITPISKETIDTLKYLKSKYKLYIISNWFTKSQKSRLKEAGILEYFDEVYGTDIIPMKPRKESFMSVIGEDNVDECVMVGDNLEVDIKVPYEIGMKVFHINKHGTSKYPTINKIEDLKEML